MIEISFSFEKMGTKTHFQKEAKGNSEMAYEGKGFRILYVTKPHSKMLSIVIPLVINCVTAKEKRKLRKSICVLPSKST